MGLDGVEIFTNSSGSHHELRKLNKRIDTIREATNKVNYLYFRRESTAERLQGSPEVSTCMRISKDAMATDYTTMDAQ
jgi:hypothetical protein